MRGKSDENQNKFQYIYERLRIAILEGEYEYGEQLLSEHQLVKNTTCHVKQCGKV